MWKEEEKTRQTLSWEEFLRKIQVSSTEGNVGFFSPGVLITIINQILEINNKNMLTIFFFMNHRSSRHDTLIHRLWTERRRGGRSRKRNVSILKNVLCFWTTSFSTGFFKIMILCWISMQSTEDLVEERNHPKSHQPVKQVRSHESQHSHRLDHPYGRYRKNRSLSAGFRHSIRNLTSCALAR